MARKNLSFEQLAIDNGVVTEELQRRCAGTVTAMDRDADGLRGVSALGARKVVAAEGLFVLGTERHDAARVDLQLIGRSGRQGDPGSSRFFLSLEDRLLRLFGGGIAKTKRISLPSFGRSHERPSVDHGSRLKYNLYQPICGEVTGIHIGRA